MAEFTTWRDLHNQLLNDLASGAFRTMQSYAVAGRTVTYRSLAELKNIIEWVKSEAEKEEGQNYYGRTFAKNGGRG